MDSQIAIRRSRGAVSGAALILLGIWGGLAPFVGSYLHFGFTPDTAWAYTTGRLYYSVLPGAAALAGGLLIVTTRSRVVGATGGVLAALGGLWFIVGSGVMLYLVKQTTISRGVPFGSVAGATSYTTKEYLEILALYTALGAVIIFFGGLAGGRLSLISARDATDAYDYSDYTPPSSGSDGGSYTGSQFPTTPSYSEPPSAQFPASGSDLPTTSGQFPTASGQFTRPSTFPPRSAPFDDAPRPLPADDQTQ